LEQLFHCQLQLKIDNVKVIRREEGEKNKMLIKILAEGGAMKPGPALSQKLGPAGIPLNKVIQEVNEATKNFQGLKFLLRLMLILQQKLLK
jgi:ribosomal protein L11